MTRLAHGASPHHAAISLHRALATVKQQLRQDNMSLNDDKEQIYGPTVAVRHAWFALTGTPAEGTAKDLGIHHYGYGHKHPVLDDKIAQFQPTAQRLAIIPTTRQRRAGMASAILYGKCLYGQESHYLTQRHFHKMRSLMTISMGLPRGQRRSGVFLLNFHNGS